MISLITIDVFLQLLKPLDLARSRYLQMIVVPSECWYLTGKRLLQIQRYRDTIR